VTGETETNGAAPSAPVTRERGEVVFNTDLFERMLPEAFAVRVADMRMLSSEPLECPM
jgi:hypothetical protein